MFLQSWFICIPFIWNYSTNKFEYVIGYNNLELIYLAHH